MVAAYVVAGLGIELFNVPWFTATQREVEPGKLARVSSLDFLFSYGLAPRARRARTHRPRHQRVRRHSRARRMCRGVFPRSSRRRARAEHQRLRAHSNRTTLVNGNDTSILPARVDVTEPAKARQALTEAGAVILTGLPATRDALVIAAAHLYGHNLRQIFPVRERQSHDGNTADCA